MGYVEIALYGIGGLVALAIVSFFILSAFYRKPGPEEAIVRTGVGGLKVQTGKGMIIVPVAHAADKMDLSVKRIEIALSLIHI